MNGSTSVPERGDVLWMHMNPQAGHEQAGHRPVLVISPASYNGLRGMSVVCPISNQQKGYPFEVELPAGLPVSGVVLSDQMKNLDWRVRATGYLARVDEETVLRVVERFLPLIDPDGIFGETDPAE